MRQKNIYTMDIIVGLLAEGKRLSKALKSVYTKRNVVIPYTEEMLDTRVADLKMSMRTTNALMRAHLKTIRDVVEFCKTEKITKLKTFGENCGIELFETILDYCWSKMDNESRTLLLVDAVQRNARYLREEF